MDFEYDPEKDVTNRSKHGVPLAFGAVILENCIGEVQDERLDYGEARVNIPTTGRIELRGLEGTVNLDRMDHE